MDYKKKEIRENYFPYFFSNKQAIKKQRSIQPIEKQEFESEENPGKRIGIDPRTKPIIE